MKFGFPTAAFSKIRFTLALCGAFASTITMAQSDDTKSKAGTSKGVAAKKATSTEVPSLKAENGPWLIMAMSFDGPNAKSQSDQLALELKRDFGLTTYCLKKTFDFTELQNGAGFDKNGNQRKMKYRDQKVVDGYAVLIGDFDAIDSPAISDALSKVKQITPKILATNNEPTDAKNDTVSVSAYRKWFQESVVVKSKDSEKTTKTGPMHGAFVTRNPLLPAEFYKAPVMDKFVKELNEQKGFSEHSLMSCPGKFSVRVVVFRGEDQTMTWGRSSARKKDEDEVTQLEVAAERAALTVRALRQAGYEAYQFHDRTQSYVTVGSFNELGKTDAANRFVYDQGIQDIVTRFGATNKITRSNFGSTPTPRLLLELVNQSMIPEITQAKGKELQTWLAKYSVAFDIKPAPMAVPRMSVYSGSLLGKDRR